MTMAADIAYMTHEEIAQSIKTSQLEQAYERALREAERIYEAERVRALRVQLLLLEDENDDLQERIDINDNDLNGLEDGNDELRSLLSEAEAELDHVQTELKARLRDLNHHKTEINALNASSSDATKLLSEKLSLSRELATLKPELEHLKSQTSTQSGLLSEKLSLQRELSTLQVELDTEKRAVQRLKTQEKNTTHDDSGLQDEVDELKKQVGKAQKESQKAEKESRKKITEWETQKEVLENKLDAFRSKLRTTKEQLKESHDELEKVQAAKMAQSAELTKARMSGNTGAAANPKKRSIARFDPDMTIGTPGNGAAAKRHKISNNLGDKSTFSITPFLNRTTLSILPESPENGDAHKQADETMNKQIEAIVEEGSREKETPKKPEKATKQKAEPKKAAPAKAKAPQPLKETTNAKANVVVRKPALAKVVEEDLEDDQENTEPTGVSAPEPAKKQKVLKRPNIFDDDDNAVPKVKSLKPVNLGNVSLIGLGKGKSKTLAEFSPLKKDRRVAPSTFS